MTSRGRPKSTEPKKNIDKLTCAACTDTFPLKDFYVSYNPIHQSGRISYCKKCLKKMISDNSGNVTLDKLKETLRLIDRPFLYNIWKISLEDERDTFGAYMKNLAMKQNRKLGWTDSKFLPEVETELNYNEFELEQVKQEPKPIFQVSTEIIDKWGNGYKTEEYEAFEKKYNLLKNNYPEKTAMHTEALLKYIRYSCKEEIFTAKGDVKEAKDWGALAKDAATAAKINPSQLSAADLADGLSGFGQLARAVEQAVDIVEILPRFKQKPQDNVDFTLWCYINYVRGLKGLGDCEYKDIYGFYEQKKKDLENKITTNMDAIESDDELEGEDNGIT